MELEKRKLRDGGESKGKRGKQREDNGGTAPPGDEEVDEFFAILKRIRVAVKYFDQRRKGVNIKDAELATKPPWNPSFEREDFEDRNEGLDLNRDPASDG